MQTVLVTGATSGIGLSIAHKLQENGFNVFGTSRFPEEHRHRVPFELLELDITSEESIQNCFATLLSKTETVNALVNNAGIGVCGSAEETSLEQAYFQLETNFWGAVKMTRAVLPLMRGQRYGKIITIGSLAGLIGVPFQPYYAASKHALEGFFKSLRFEVNPFNIKVSVVEPGFFKSNLHHSFAYAEPHIADYDSNRNNALQVFTDSITKAPLPDPVADTVLKILKAKNPNFSYRVGRDARWYPILQFAFTRLFESGTARKFKIRKN